MIRDWLARASEVRDLRDRAVLDARLIRDLNATLTRRTAELDQANARARDLDASVEILTAIAHRLGVTCIHPLPDGDIAVHVNPTKDTP